MTPAAVVLLLKELAVLGVEIATEFQKAKDENREMDLSSIGSRHDAINAQIQAARRP